MNTKPIQPSRREESKIIVHIKFINSDLESFAVDEDNLQEILDTIKQAIEDQSTVVLGNRIINCRHILGIVIENE